MSSNKVSFLQAERNVEGVSNPPMESKVDCFIKYRLFIFDCFFIYTAVFLGFPLTVWRLAKVAIFTTNIDAENQTLINHKCVCGALNPLFCQTPVEPKPALRECEYFGYLQMHKCNIMKKNSQ